MSILLGSLLPEEPPYSLRYNSSIIRRQTMIYWTQPAPHRLRRLRPAAGTAAVAVAAAAAVEAVLYNLHISDELISKQ
jgi:hypothetical protein